jgi:hypothetical protein
LTAFAALHGGLDHGIEGGRNGHGESPGDASWFGTSNSAIVVADLEADQTRIADITQILL